jgi:hypothetical protein
LIDACLNHAATTGTSLSDRKILRPSRSPSATMASAPTDAPPILTEISGIVATGSTEAALLAPYRKLGLTIYPA